MSTKKRTKNRRQITPEEELDKVRGVLLRVVGWARYVRRDLLRAADNLDGIAKLASERWESTDAAQRRL